MYHWESPKIAGAFENCGGRWYIRVDCEKHGIFPEMLSGRLITIKGAIRRLGDYIPGGKRNSALFWPWPDNIGDYVPPPHVAHQCRRLYMQAAEGNIEKEVFNIRMEIKADALRERRRRSPLPPWPSIIAWERWALEYLDSTLLSLAGAGLIPPPPNQFQYITPPDVAALAAEVFAA